jgi:spermidine/putrescine transport system substrate-binding protein
LEYVKYCYEDEDGVPYDLSYFFGEDTVVTVSKDQLHRQLLAQYPTEDVINRCAVMSYYDVDANKRISQMWTNIRCFRFPWEH